MKKSNCKTCGGEYTRTSTRQLYCNTKCNPRYAKWRIYDVPKSNCKTCNKLFIKTSPRQMFCNPKCNPKKILWRKYVDDYDYNTTFVDIENLWYKLKSQGFNAHFEDVFVITHLHCKVAGMNSDMRGNDFYMMMIDIIDFYKKNKKQNDRV